MKQVDNFIYKRRKEFKHNYKIIHENISHALKDNLWTIAYTDEYLTKSKKKVIHIFGFSSAFAGSNVFSMFLNGARYVPFLIVLYEKSKQSCIVKIITGGSENALGIEFGRNKKVGKKILELCSEFHH